MIKINIKSNHLFLLLLRIEKRTISLPSDFILGLGFIFSIPVVHYVIVSFTCTTSSSGSNTQTVISVSKFISYPVPLAILLPFVSYRSSLLYLYFIFLTIIFSKSSGSSGTSSISSTYALERINLGPKEALRIFLSELIIVYFNH